MNNFPKIYPVILDGTFFSVISINEDSNKVSAKCEICHSEKIIKGALSSSGNFLLHLKRAHPESLHHYEQRKKEIGPSLKKKKYEAKTKNGPSLKTGSCEGNFRWNRVDPIRLRNPSNIDQLILNFIVQGIHPIRIVEDPEFQNLIKGLNPYAIIPSKTALSTYIMEEYTRKANDIKTHIKYVDYFCITVDMWKYGESIQNFVGTTIHWISGDLRRNSAALSCQISDEENSIETITNSLKQVLQFYEIFPEKVIQLLADNGPTIPEELGKEQKPQCKIVEFCSILEKLSLAISGQKSNFSLPQPQRNLNGELSRTYICDFQDLPIDLHKSSLLKCCSMWNVISGATAIPERTSVTHTNLLTNLRSASWNSIYNCVVSLLEHRTECAQICLLLDVPALTELEFDYLEEYALCVKPVATAVDRLQGDSNCFFGELIPTLITVDRKMNELLEMGSLKFCEPLARAILSRIQNRFGGFLELDDVHANAIVAAVCHPYFKLRWVPEHKTDAVWNLFVKETCKLVNIFSKPEDDFLNASLNYFSSNLIESKRKEKDDDFFSFSTPTMHEKSVSELTDKVRIECLQYLECSDTNIQMLHSFPSVKKMFIKFNSALPSAGPVERLFNFSQMISSLQGQTFEKNNWSEKLILLKANSQWNPS